MKGSRLPVSVLAARVIPSISSDFKKKLNIPEEHTSVALFTTDSDDVGYVALDEATKVANVSVALGKSFYAGAANANTKLAGEFIGILSGTSPDEVTSGLAKAVDFATSNVANFISANDQDTIPYFAHCVARPGSFLSSLANVKAGESIAYLVAPPLEAIYAIDAALKAADVTLAMFAEPPTETNFAAAYLTGSQSACQAACDAFARAVESVANQSIIF